MPVQNGNVDLQAMVRFRKSGAVLRHSSNTHTERTLLSDSLRTCMAVDKAPRSSLTASFIQHLYIMIG